MTRTEARAEAERTRLALTGQWQAIETQFPIITGVVDRLVDDPDYLDQLPGCGRDFVQLIALVAKLAMNKSKAERIIDEINREEDE